MTPDGLSSVVARFDARTDHTLGRPTGLAAVVERTVSRLVFWTQHVCAQVLQHLAISEATLMPFTRIQSWINKFCTEFSEIQSWHCKIQPWNLENQSWNIIEWFQSRLGARSSQGPKPRRARPPARAWWLSELTL